MSARLRPEQVPTPVRSDSPPRGVTLKHRLFCDEGADEEADHVRPPAPKKRARHTCSVAPLFDRHKAARPDEHDRRAPGFLGPGRRQRRSPSPDRESPLAAELDARYAHLRATLRSAAHAGLAEAEAELSAGVDASVRASRERAAALESQVARLLTPLRDLSVDYTATGADGRQRTAAVAIRSAVAAFEAELSSARDDLDRLWAERDAAQAEIEALGREVLQGHPPQLASLRKGDRQGEGTGDGEKGKEKEESGERAIVQAELGAELDRAGDEAIEEMALYEDKFLKEIENEGGNILRFVLGH
ncbi:hypothetical protein GGS23DRAFT_599674 [Durotheca rogersii]|uniref:uncharacterized protein n=1 Tax=Durotheca rogersii TaxID=419775 RepID=UPI00221ED2A0|nr:uncharacterized protein GGS23DRAFT_599674 [Durotheca rogersii]KAI5860305.1 hypothetical protein GGS23DRAFT_599674 [Durotheca rogersii]